jgi:sugar lactone lactonase YvrE
VDSVWGTAGADQTLRQAFECATYSLRPSGYGTWRGANASLTLEFNSRTARITHHDGSVDLQLTGYGRGDRLRKPAHAKLTGEANRVEYQREDITEWYLNTSQGLEQGFALKQRPRSDRKGEPLVVALRVSGGLHPFQRTGDESVLFRSSSSVVLRYDGLRALDARGRTLPSRLELRGGEIRLIVSDQDAQYPLVVDPIWTQQQELTASNGEPGDVLTGTTGDEFGYSVSLSGDTAVIGARNRTVNSQANQGAAYVFVRSGGLWTQQQELTASDGAGNDSFGQAVSLIGDIAVIGANGKNGYQGAAYVFVRSGGVWSQQQELNASDGAANDQFGGSVSLGESTVVIGAWGKTIDLNPFQGSAYVFVQDSGVWTQRQELTASDGAMIDGFGYSVSVSGNTMLIGANGKNSGEGSAYLFVFNGATWGQQQELTSSDGAASDFFGQAVSVTGNTALIGAPSKDGSQGAAYVFVQSGGVWSQMQELSASDGAANDQFGGSVSLSSDTAVIGASNHHGNLGAAYVFALSAGTWAQQQELTALDGAMNDEFGWSSAVSGETVVIGAMEKDNGQGTAYAFVSSESATQTISFLALGGQAFEAAPFAVGATASSGLPVSFASTTLSVCAVSGATVTLVAIGTCTVVAYQPGNAYYAGAPSVAQSFEVLPGSQTIAFGALASVPLGTAPFTTGATASSGLPVGFASRTPAVCAVSDAIVTLLSVGVCSIWATQPGNIDYAAAAPVMQSFAVTQGGTAGPDISSLSPASAALGGTAFQLAVGGEGFLPGAVVMWNGTALPTSFASATSLTAQVRASLIASAGTATVTVVNPGGAAAGGVAFPVWPELGTDALLVGSAGRTSSVILPYDGAWTATANDSFLHVSPGSGSGIGSAVVLFTYDAFTGTGSRTGTLTIAGLTVTVTQAGTNYVGPFGPGPAIALAWADTPPSLAVDSSGNVYSADSQNGAIREWNASTQQVNTLVSSGLNDPCGVAVDSSGNVYIADSVNDTIKEWSASTRQVTTLVSSGLNGPCGVAVDRSGNVYIADTFNSAIEEWSASTQQVTTLVSSGLQDPFALAVDASGNVYIADTENGAIKEWSASTQQVTTLVSSGLFMPFGIAVDGSGNVYIADTFNSAIEEWSASTQQVTTLVSSGLLMPRGVAVDGSGNVYIADTFNNAIKGLPYAFVGPASLSVSVSAGTDSLMPVLPSAAPLTGVYAPTSDSSWLTIESVANGIVSFSFAGATFNSNVAHISLLGQQITITQNALPAQTITFGVLADQPLGTPPFTVEATASSGLTVRFNSQTTSVCTVAGNTVTLVAVGACTIQATQSGSVNYSAATAVNQSFQVTPASSSAPVISSLSPASAPRGGSAFMLTVNGAGFLDGAEVMWDGTTLWTTFVSGTTLSAWVSDSLISSVGTATVAVVNPGAIASGGVGFTIWPGLGTNTLFVGSAAGKSSVELPYNGAWTTLANDSFLHIAAGSTSGTGSALIVFSYDAFTGTGSRTGTLTIAGLTVTVTQVGTSYIGPFGPAPLITLASSGLNGPYGVAVDGSGNVYIADSQNSVIREWNASTQLMTTLVSSGLNDPSGVAVDNSGNVYIADTVNNAIKEWSASTQQVTTLVSSGLNGPSSVAVDGSGNVYIADTLNGAIKEWSASTQQVTALVSSGLFLPFGVAVDGSGNVYIADTFNNAIREWSVSTQQVTTLVSSGLKSPRGVAVEGSGNVYIADTLNGAIEEWSASTQQVTTLAPSGLNEPYGVAVDASGNVYIADTFNNAIKEIPYAFVGPASLTEPASAGTDSLLPVLPSTAPVTGVFAPTSDSSWLTIGTVANGVVSFSFAANMQTSRMAHIALLGQQISVTQDSLTDQTITFGALANQPLGTAPFTVSASASSGLPVSFGTTAPAVCTVSGMIVTLVSEGTCTIWATQVGNVDYLPATSVSESFEVTQGSTAVPSVSSLTPASAVLGGTAFTLTVNGTGFVAGAVAEWNGVALSTNFVSATRLTASVAATLIASAGIATVTVVNPGGAVASGVAFPIWPGLGTNAVLVGSVAGTSSVVVPYPGAWIATANGSFLHIPSGSASGTDSAVVVFTYDAFTGTGIRTGTLTIAGLTVTVTQAGMNYIGPIRSGPPMTLASSALDSPYSVAVDGLGNVYIADTLDNAIKEWSGSTQQVTTLVSSGLNGPSGVAVDGSGSVYIADSVNNAIKEWNASTQQVTTLVSSGLNGPSGVAVDGSGNVYIADSVNNAIKEWNASTQQVTTLVSSGLSRPSGVAVDGGGNVYIADTFNNAIKEWSASTQQVTTLVSSGMNSPRGVAVDGSGNVYIADTFEFAIKEWSASTQQVTSLVSSGLDGPSGVAVDGTGNVYFADTFNDAIKEIPYAFVGPASLTEPASAGTDSLLPVLPSTAPLAGVYAPTSDSSWLTIGTVANGVVSFSFAANMQTSRIAHVALLGQQISVTQDALTDQTITFGALANQPLGAAPFTVSATASSGLTVSFKSQTPSICTVAGNTVTLVAVGTCTVQATQAGNANYSAANPENQSFQVTQASQTITFGALANRPLGAAPFTVSAMASSGLSVSFASTTLTVCTVAGTTVTLVGVGTCTIQATQAGNTTYAPATAVNQSFQVTQTSQAITFGALADRVFSTMLFTVSATASSGLPVSFASTTLTVCTVAGTTVTLVGVGTCAIQASQAGNTNYPPATPANQSFQVTQASQTITFRVLASQPYGTAPLTVTATASSGLAVSFGPQTTSICTVVGSLVTLVTVGTCTIQATQAGNANYAAAAAVSRSFAVTQASQTISFGALAIQALGTAPFTVSATASSGLPVSFASTTLTVCTVAGNTVTLLSAGICIVQATQAGNASYSAATAVNQPFQVTQTSQTISFGALANQALGTAPFTVSATASSGLPVSFSSQTTSVCTVSGSQVTMVAVGTCTIQATQAGSATYAAATPVNRSFQVNGALSFVPITPCRVVDTRSADGSFGGPSITGGSSRDFTIPNGICGIPSTAQAYSLNAAMVPTGGGWITLWPTGQPKPLAASVNSPDGRVKSDGAIVPAGTGGAISVYASVTTDVVLDINGYFVPAPSNPTALAFYPVTPCRVADTRKTAGPLGGPYMSGGSTRTFSILAASACGIPSSAQAFSLNLAVMPQADKLGWLTAWPAGQTQPSVASLNDPPGVVLSNAAIVPAPSDNSGQIDIYVTQDTHLVIDINGYFAPPGAGGLSLYTLQPCRVLDTRNPAGAPPFTGTLAVDVVDSGCGAPSTAQDYVLNATVVPQASHGYLTMWQEGQSMPVAANLNSSDGAVTGNMALVPTANGWIDTYFSGTTYLVLDLFGYFAP